MRKSKGEEPSFGSLALALSAALLFLPSLAVAGNDPANDPANDAEIDVSRPTSVSQATASLPDDPTPLTPSLPEAAVNDGDPATAPDAPTATVSTAPVLDRESLLVLAQRDVSALGPLSIGTPDAGLLVNPLPMPTGTLWTIRNPAESYATAETIDFIRTAIEDVEKRYPGSPPIVIGDISRRDGGRLNRHRSHQAGRDVDLGFYYSRGECDEFRVARKGDLDLPRTWALVKALLTETDADRIFLDRLLQRVLYAEAVAEGEDRDWLDDIFGRLGEDRKGIIQHEKRHKNHLHVRFFNRLAQERARLVYPMLVETGSVPPPVVKHRVRSGETLGAIAQRYGTSTSAIRAANGLRSTMLRAGRSYRIPIRRVPDDNGPIVVPPRRLPPAPTHAVDMKPAQPAGSGAAIAAP